MALNLLERRLLGTRFNWSALRTFAKESTTSSKESGIMDEALANNPFYKKYAAKLAAEEQKKVAKKSEQEVKKLEDQEAAKPKDAPPQVAKKEVAPKSKLMDKLKPKGKTPVAPFVPKKLSDIVKMELLEDKTGEEIGQIWQDFHRYKDGLAAVIPGAVFRVLRTRGQRYPTFLLPLPRSEGYEFIISQFQHNQVHFALLGDYQIHRENASECLTLTYYAELLESKDVVLMRGEFDTARLSVLEAQCLANTLQLYYGGAEHVERDRLLKTFNDKPKEFDHMDLIREIENIGFGEKRKPLGDVRLSKLPPPPQSHS